MARMSIFRRDIDAKRMAYYQLAVVYKLFSENKKPPCVCQVVWEGGIARFLPIPITYLEILINTKLLLFIFLLSQVCHLCILQFELFLKANCYQS